MLKCGEDFVSGDYFVMDSAFTGKQRLKLFGVRAGKKHVGQDWDGPKPESDNVTLEQRVFSVETPIMHDSPVIRDGVCGTPCREAD